MKFRIAVALFAVLGISANLAYASTGLNEVFSQLEQMYSLPPGILGKVANVESGGNASLCAQASSACGLFQWTQNSWYSASYALYGRSLDLSSRFSPVTSAKVTAFALKQAQAQNGSLIAAARLDQTLGLYLCHFLGSGGCQRFFQAYMQNPAQSAAAIFPREARSNASVFSGRSLAGVADFFAAKLRVAGTGISIAGSYVDSNGVSLAYSNGDVQPGSFMPATFVPPPQDPYYTYQTAYAPASSLPTVAPPSALPQQGNTATPQAATLPASPAGGGGLNLQTASSSASPVSAFLGAAFAATTTQGATGTVPAGAAQLLAALSGTSTPPAQASAAVLLNVATGTPASPGSVQTQQSVVAAQNAPVAPPGAFNETITAVPPAAQASPSIPLSLQSILAGVKAVLLNMLAFLLRPSGT